MEMTNKRWYVINCYSGHERKVKEALEKRIETMGMQNNIFQVLIAEYIQLKPKADGTVQEKMKNTFPGYLFVEMIMSDESWFVVRNTPGVTGFIGSSGKGAKPFPVQPQEIANVKALQGRIDDSLLKVEWKLDQVVEIINGSMKGQAGPIDEVNLDNKTVIVMLEMFGRKTPTEVSFDDIIAVK